MGSPLVIAHRGYCAAAPENTLAAFEAALRVGSDMLELDVRLDADGAPVVLHDETLDRTTDASGPVERMSSARLREVDAGSWFSPAFAGERVPTLLEVAELVSRFPGVGLLVEFKGVWAPSDVAGAVGVLRATGIAQDSILQSFERSTVAALREVAPDLRRALLVLHPGPAVEWAALAKAFHDVVRDPFTALASGWGEAREQAATAAREFGVVAVNPYVASVVARPDVVRQYHAAGVATYPYTVDDPRLWQELVTVGVDGIITNDPGRLRGFLDAHERHYQDSPDEGREELTRLAVRQGRTPERTRVAAREGVAVG